ncbi:MAG: hypothetical protein V3V12_05405 [Gammaproteobacteria bacterium]
MTTITNTVNVERIEISIEMLREYVKETSIEPIITLLESMKKAPGNEQLLETLSETFNALGIVQGAILTYAPYVGILISEDPFGNG